MGAGGSRCQSAASLHRATMTLQGSGQGIASCEAASPAHAGVRSQRPHRHVPRSFPTLGVELSGDAVAAALARHHLLERYDPQGPLRGLLLVEQRLRVDCFDCRFG